MTVKSGENGVDKPSKTAKQAKQAFGEWSSWFFTALSLVSSLPRHTIIIVINNQQQS